MKKLLTRLIKHIVFGSICTFAFSGISIYYLKPKIALLEKIHPQWQVIWLGALFLCCAVSFLIATTVTHIVIARSKKNSKDNAKRRQFSKIGWGIGGATTMLFFMLINNHLDFKGAAIFNMILFVFLMSLSYSIFILYLKGKDIGNKTASV